MSANVLLTYPNHNSPFEIYRDASDYQMGAVIIQNGKIVAYWSKKFKQGSVELLHNGEGIVSGGEEPSGISDNALGRPYHCFY
jgi:hypothetical protein